MSGDSIVAIVVACVSAAIGLVSIIATARGRRADSQAQDRRARMPSWRELSDRVGNLEDEFRRHRLATGNVLSDAEQQWPKGYPPPVLDPRDIEELGDTVPLPWRRSYLPPRPVAEK